MSPSKSIYKINIHCRGNHSPRGGSPCRSDHTATTLATGALQRLRRVPCWSWSSASPLLRPPPLPVSLTSPPPSSHFPAGCLLRWSATGLQLLSMSFVAGIADVSVVTVEFRTSECECKRCRELRFSDREP
ncbi:sigma-70, partial [Striga asiatica]